MNSPYIICHMITSLDGRLLPQRWPSSMETVMAVYERTADTFDVAGWIVGRRTMQEILPSGEVADLVAPVSRNDWIGPKEAAAGICICFDRFGRIKPHSGDVNGDHLVIVLSEQVSNHHVDMLKSRGVSVFFAGADGSAIREAITRIADAFSSQRLLLEGGGELNGAFLAADLIDETSTLVFPVIDGEKGMPAIYDSGTRQAPREIELISAETIEDGVVWLRHRINRS